MVGGMPSSQFPALGSTRRVHSSLCITWPVYQSSPSCTTAAAAAAATIATITTTNAWSIYLFSVTRAGAEGPSDMYLCVRVSAKQPPESYRPAGMAQTPLSRFRNSLVNDFPRFDSAVLAVSLKTMLDARRRLLVLSRASFICIACGKVGPHSWFESRATTWIFTLLPDDRAPFTRLTKINYVFIYSYLIFLHLDV